MADHLEMGLDTFGDVTSGPDGGALPHAQVIRDVIAEGAFADELALDFFGVGEHHRADFAISSPETVLAALASKTTKIHLGSAVTVLSSDDPVRLFQRFSTLDAISNGRAEVMLGRGSFTESFPLFGFELDQYEKLFEERLELFSLLITRTSVTWSGATRAALQDQQVFPPVETGRLKTWIGVGGSPKSVVRAASYDLPLMLAIIGGDPGRFRGYVDLYHRAFAELGKTPKPIGVHSPGYVATTDEQARDEFWPSYKIMRDRIGAERGWPPMAREEFDREADRGSLYVGSPETVARKIAKTVEALGLSRFDLKYSAGPLSHNKLMHCIELYARRVVPLVRDMLA
ncbi:putative LLM family oxidoreductase [Rhodoligotrophos appendicifer]|uniref:LLM class flavin-dependent oxidoreductase n=1 Tax=Rhodoligotrophos appendicifer TaxID=987056 RepID=UPI001186E4BB|nr:LLM class flavin-dependent oxidoreductase [Rhodoligotrophos appendicifer]